MKNGRSIQFVVLACITCAGCNVAKVTQLTAQVAKLEAEVQELKAKNAKLETDLGVAKAQVAQTELIRQGYETARSKLQESLGALAPLLGNTGSPLPAFEELKDPSWIGRLAPTPQTAAGLNELQSTLQGLMGNPPAPSQPPAPQPVPAQRPAPQPAPPR